MIILGRQVVFISAIMLSGVMVACNTTPAHDPFEEFNKATGHWSVTFDSTEITETWEKVSDTLFTGNSMEITGNDSVPGESLQLVKRGNEIYYIPTVFSQNEGKPIMFRMTSYHDGVYVFENPDHDFPNKIVYKLSAEKMKATVSGTVNGKPRSFDLDYSKK